MGSSEAQAPASVATPDLCVIGAGMSGQALAMAAAAFGVSVILVERGPLGPEGPLRRRPALQALTQAGARLGSRRRNAARDGAAPDEDEMAKALDQARSGAGALAVNGTAERLAALGVQVLRGHARFTGRSSLDVEGLSIRARRFVIATGARETAPTIEGLDPGSVTTPSQFLALKKRPARVIVLGADAASCEMAQAARRLGSAVCLVSETALLPHEDPEAVALLRRSLMRDGIDLRESIRPLRAQGQGHRLRLFIDAGAGEEAIEADAALVAGRQADIAGLDLDLAGVRHDPGGVVVDRGLRTGNRRVFALGACAARPPGLPYPPGSGALEAGRLLRQLLFRLPVRRQPERQVRLVLTDPEIASVGLSEVQARDGGRAVTLLRLPYAESERAQASGSTEGFVKLIADGKGRLLGAVVAGERAGDMLAPWCVALQQGLRLTDMAGTYFATEALSDLSRKAAATSYAPLAARPGIRRLAAFLRRFG